jgi:hypothetical protein
LKPKDGTFHAKSEKTLQYSCLFSTLETFPHLGEKYYFLNITLLVLKKKSFFPGWGNMFGENDFFFIFNFSYNKKKSVFPSLWENAWGSKNESFPFKLGKITLI